MTFFFLSNGLLHNICLSHELWKTNTMHSKPNRNDKSQQQECNWPLMPDDGQTEAIVVITNNRPWVVAGIGPRWDSVDEALDST